MGWKDRHNLLQFPRETTLAFTLIEMSVVLIVIGLIILSVFPALTSMRTASQRAVTESNLKSLMRATAVYVQANGCLPCPTPATTVGTGFGRVRGSTGTDACGSCTSAMAEGIPPYASLGIPASVAHDGWGRWITMRIDTALAVNFGVTPPTSPCLSSDPSPCTTGLSQKGLCRASINADNRVKIKTVSGATQDAAVVFASHGANGYGAFVAGALYGEHTGERLPFTANTKTCAQNYYEKCNADGNAEFVDASVVSGGDRPFDDILTFLDRNNLISFLGNTSCQTLW